MPGSKKTALVQCGRDITTEELGTIRETVEMFPKLSRSELTATICEHLEWFAPTGACKLDACAKLLEKLEDEGLLKLPEKIETPKKKRKPVAHTTQTSPRPDMICTLKELGTVHLEIVQEDTSKKLWNEYVSRYHYLGYKHPFGTYIRYFITSDQGILGCIMFCGAAKSMKLRDKWIGWTIRQKARNQGWVINNYRFLILPWVQVKNLASHVLGKVTRAIKNDWLEQWGFEPVLMETFVDPQLYAGSCYKAANWQYLGMTTGEGLARKGKTYSTTPKMILVMPLTKKFREILCSKDLQGRIL